VELNKEKTKVVDALKGEPFGFLFLHYAFGLWMEREHRDIPFERYADDAICHCRTEQQAKHLQVELAQRFLDCGLELHPQKTKIVYCADSRRTEKYSDVQFDFLGYAFRPRFVKSSNGKFFVGFNEHLARWAMRKYRSLRGHRRRAREWIGNLLRSKPQLFAHRRFVLGMAG
jgi:RNA-directed DNA polymerase